MYIMFPTGRELQNVTHGFDNKWGFPSCAGAIDRTHIPTVAHPGEPHYFNRKGCYSIVMQPVVDDKYCFRDCYIGWPGSVHDARILRNSALFTKATAGTLCPNQCVQIEWVGVHPLTLGDPAYPFLPWLMKPFPHRCSHTREQRHFSYRLSRAQLTVEKSFGRLKGRWRRLFKRLDVKTEDVLYFAPKTYFQSCLAEKLEAKLQNSAWIRSSAE